MRYPDLKTEAQYQQEISTLWQLNEAANIEVKRLQEEIVQLKELAEAQKDSIPVYLRPAPIPEGWKLLKTTTIQERSWSEDASDENGNYANTCCECGREFVGYKRRIVCRSCAAAPKPGEKE